MELTKKEWRDIILQAIFMTLLMVLPLGFLIYARIIGLIKPEEVWFWGFVCWGWAMMVVSGHRLIHSLKMINIFEKDN